MKILITGITGFIGSHLAEHLLSNSTYKLYAIIRRKSNISYLDKRITFFEYDSDVEKLISFFKNEKFDGIVHLASLFLATHHSLDIKTMLNSNIEFGTELLEASKITNVKWFINTGTFWQHYQNEDYNPVNLYAATKEAFQNIAKYYMETSNLVFVTIKLCDSFGEGDTRSKIFNLWEKIAKSEETLEMSMGEQIIDISYIEDIVRAYAILIEHLNSNNFREFRNKTFAVKSNETMSLKELSKLFEEVTSKKLNIVWGGREYREREVMIPWTKGDIVPGWKQTYTLKSAIKKTITNNLTLQHKG